MTLDEKEREILLQSLKQFRSEDDETDGDYSNRDELEQKLSTGNNDFNEVDIHMLAVALNVVHPNEHEDLFTKINPYQ